MEKEQRFKFGKNWKQYLPTIDDDSIDTAEKSLRDALGVSDLKGKKFLDIGCGSGLFSLAAVRMGAEVVSIDFDYDSVDCAKILKESYYPGYLGWTILQGSVLDQPFMRSLGEFDVVYSWGVLHHTGNMKLAMELAAASVQSGGQLFIAIYNDQGGASRRWLRLKMLYHKLPKFLRTPYVLIIATWYEVQFSFKRLLKFQNPLPAAAKSSTGRAMKVWIDWVDWVGGLPYEYAKPEDIIHPLRDSGFILDKLRTINGWGCNEYVFHLDKLLKNKVTTHP